MPTAVVYQAGVVPSSFWPMGEAPNAVLPIWQRTHAALPPLCQLGNRSIARSEVAEPTSSAGSMRSSLR